MNKLTSLLIAGAVVATTLVGGNAIANAANNNKACTVSDFGMAMGKSGNITVAGSTATVKFRVNGTNCTTPVSVASWIRVTAEGINDQKLYAHNTKTFKPGLNSMTVKVPACMYQVDLIEGSHYTAADGTANYQFQDGKFVDGGLRDFIKGGSGTCEEKPEVCPIDPSMKKDDPNCKVCPLDPTMAINDKDCKETPKNPETPTTPETPVYTKDSPVSAVPNTGAGSVLGATFGISSITGLVYSFIERRKRI